MDKNTNGGVCMDKKANNKTLNFFKKEGFYVILFVCLCIVATVATITANNNKSLSSKQQASARDALKEQEKEYQGALQVKENAAKGVVLKEVPNIKKVTTDNLKATAPVSETVDSKFEKPVANGLMARTYSKDVSPIVWKTDGTYRTNLGIDIQAKLGEPVVAVMDGIVKEVGTDVEDQNGKMVIIDHQNGLVTKYSNLDEKILVKKGDKVTKKQQIAMVGNTSLNSYKEEYGAHLHFAVFQSNKSIDPARYEKYEKYQPAEVKQ